MNERSTYKYTNLTQQGDRFTQRNTLNKLKCSDGNLSEIILIDTLFTHFCGGLMTPFKGMTERKET